jgi:tellurite resistance protein
LGEFSGRQIAVALLAILLTLLTLSVVQELGKDPQYRKFGNIAFMTFLMFFTYGLALNIALVLKRNVGMGYNELTRQRSWLAYLTVGVITSLSWLVASFSWRYIWVMRWPKNNDLSHWVNVTTDIGWSYPYALQSLALAISVSWILDFHQSRGMAGKLKLHQRSFDVGILVAALGFASIIAWCWMDGPGLLKDLATREEPFRTNNPLSWPWTVIKGMAIGAVVGWLVPTWFYINRTKAPDQIAGRLISMNKKGLSKEIRNLKSNELIKAISAVAASIAAVDHVVSRSEKDVFLIICSSFAGLPNSDVDIDSAEKEFDLCRELIYRRELQLESRLQPFRRLPLLSSLLPFVASSIAYADGVYQNEEHEIVELVKRYLEPPKSVMAGL